MPDCADSWSASFDLNDAQHPLCTPVFIAGVMDDMSANHQIVGLLIAAAFYLGPQLAELSAAEQAPLSGTGTLHIYGERLPKDAVCIHSSAVIAAPLGRVVSVALDFPRQVLLFAGYHSITSQPTGTSQWMVKYDQEVALVGHERYSLEWESSAETGGTVLRYRLNQGTQLKSANGSMRFTAAGKKTTYVGLDCFITEGVPGFLREKAYSDSLEQTAQEDGALFLAAEHRDWPDSRVREKATAIAERAVAP